MIETEYFTTLVAKLIINKINRYIILNLIESYCLKFTMYIFKIGFEVTGSISAIQCVNF